MSTWAWANTTTQRDYIDKRDIQRQWYGPVGGFNQFVVSYQSDMNPQSPTFGFPLFELWPIPATEITYQLYGIRKGAPLVNDSDTLPPQIGEDCVIALAKAYAYEWAEANKGDVPRGAGSDYRFLIQSTRSDFKRLYADYRRTDRALVDNFRKRGYPSYAWAQNGYYSAYAGVASPGAAW